MNVVFGLILLLVTLPAVYLGMLALAAIPNRRVAPSAQPRHRFAIAIPAHNEESVIGQTVSIIKKMDYAPDLFDVLVVADHCSDQTAEIAREAGALAYERQEEPRGSKGAALRWLFQRTLEAALTTPSSSLTPTPMCRPIFCASWTRALLRVLRSSRDNIAFATQKMAGFRRSPGPCSW